MKLCNPVPVRTERKALAYLPLYDGGMREPALDNILSNGISVDLPEGMESSILRHHKVELAPGRTREELVEFLRKLKPCSNLEAFEAAQNRGLVAITLTGERVEVRRRGK